MWLLFKNRRPKNNMQPTPTLGGLSLKYFWEGKKDDVDKS
jgi:hypothetical protein